jgi:hypothetical protein
MLVALKLLCQRTGDERMFIRSKEVKGATYYQVVEGYREGSRVRHRTLISLGQNPTLAEAEALERSRRTATARRLARLKRLGFGSGGRLPRSVQADGERLQQKLTQHDERLTKLADLAHRYERPRREEQRETARLNDAEGRTWYVPALAEACRRRDEGIDCDWCGRTLADAEGTCIVQFGGRRYCCQYCADARRRNPIVPYPTGD